MAVGGILVNHDLRPYRLLVHLKFFNAQHQQRRERAPISHQLNSHQQLQMAVGGILASHDCSPPLLVLSVNVF
jgi:hypothetical protein